MTKTISLSDESYEALSSAKRPGESFTEVVRRLARLAALEDVFDPAFRLEGDGSAWKEHTRRAREKDKRARFEL